MIASPVAFTRSGGRSLGGIERTTRTDKGFWRVSMEGMTVHSPAQRRVWNAINTELNGKQGLVAIPVWSFDSAPYPSGQRERPAYTTHADDTPFDDDSQYRQGSIDVEMSSYAALGATVVTIKLVNASTASGIHFSYQHAIYKTGKVIEQTGADTYRVPIFPAIRQAIPAGAALECDMPTLLCHLADDRGMDIALTAAAVDATGLEFVEAVDFWTDLAAGLVTVSGTYYPPYVAPYDFDPSLDFSQAGNSQYIPL